MRHHMHECDANTYNNNNTTTSNRMQPNAYSINIVYIGRMMTRTHDIITRARSNSILSYHVFDISSRVVIVLPRFSCMFKSFQSSNTWSSQLWNKDQRDQPTPSLDRHIHVHVNETNHRQYNITSASTMQNRIEQQHILAENHAMRITSLRMVSHRMT